MVGFRNLATHQYQKIKLEVLEDIVEKKLEDLIKYTNKIQDLDSL